MRKETAVFIERTQEQCGATEGDTALSDTRIRRVHCLSATARQATAPSGVHTHLVLILRDTKQFGLAYAGNLFYLHSTSPSHKVGYLVTSTRQKILEAHSKNREVVLKD